MWSGCITCGKNTRLGSGKRRATPQKPASGEKSLMGSFLVQILIRIGPRFGGGVDGDLRDQRLVGRDTVWGLLGGEDRREAGLHLFPEDGLIESPVRGAVFLHVS